VSERDNPAGYRILVIDDNPAIQEDYRKILAASRHGAELSAAEAALFGDQDAPPATPEFHVESAFQGQQGLALVQQALAQQNPFALAFVDARMPPGWDGMETVAKIWQHDPDIQIVICTAYSDYSWGEVLERLGHSDQLVVLKKPFDLIEVLQLASALTEKWRLARQSRSILEGLEHQVAARTCALAQAGERLQASEAQYRLLFESNPNPMWVYNLETLRFLKVNGAAVEHYGYSEKRFLAMTIRDIRPEEEVARLEQYVDALKGQGKAFGVWHHRTGDGSIIDVELSSDQIVFDGHLARLVLANDVTERLRGDEQLQLARDEALHALRAKSQFLANMSHEIRTPMNGVIGMTEVLLESDLTSSQRDAAETIRYSADLLLTIINDILDFSKIEAGAVRVEAVNLDLPKVLELAVAQCADSAAGKGLKLTSSFDIEGLPILRGDSGRLRRVLFNLISNAVKFTERGDVHVAVALERQSATEAVVRFTVRDSGIGISAEVQQHLFQSFMQADSSMTRRYGGTGLGLAISKQLVEQMGGAIGTDSEPGRGSTFWFIVPLEKSTSLAEATGASGTSPAVAALSTNQLRRGRWRALVADDKPINRMVARNLLQRLGLPADFVDSGRQAVEALARQRYDLVFMDCQMPGLDGYGATAGIRRQEHNDAHTWIVGMTAYEMGGDREKCLAAGMNDYLAGPLRAQTLREALERFESNLTLASHA
jgi:PAS domain S-box-containing protein